MWFRPETRLLQTQLCDTKYLTTNRGTTYPTAMPLTSLWRDATRASATANSAADAHVTQPVDRTAVPRHIAFIMDGNGRWARQRGQPRLFGHRAGTQNLRRVLETCGKRGVEVVTIYAFSTENWGRPQDEVTGLFQILSEAIGREAPALHERGVQIRHLGSMEGVPDRLSSRIADAVRLTANNRHLILNVAFNYGSRAEIVEAVRRLVATGIPANEIDEAAISANLYTAGLPDPDLIVRTAGEFRLSNFLLWQAAYAEYYSTPTCWPDFDEAELERAIAAFAARHRKYGGVENHDG